MTARTYGEYRKTTVDSLDDPVSRVQMRETLDYSLRRMMLTVFKSTRLIPTWKIETIIKRPGPAATNDPLDYFATIAMKSLCEPPILKQPGNYNKLRRMGWPN